MNIGKVKNSYTKKNINNKSRRRNRKKESQKKSNVNNINEKNQRKKERNKNWNNQRRKGSKSKITGRIERGQDFD